MYHKIVFLLLLVLSFVACARGQLSTPMPFDPQTAGEIVVIRKKHYVGGASVIITLDEQDLVSMKMGDYTTVKVSPERHTVGIYIKGIDKKAYEYLDKGIALDCPPRTSKFITVIVKFNEIVLEEIGPSQAFEFMKAYKYIPLYQSQLIN